MTNDGSMGTNRTHTHSLSGGGAIMCVRDLDMSLEIQSDISINLSHFLSQLFRLSECGGEAVPPLSCA